MTLQSSGAITIAQINAEFGRGTNLNSYRGTSWFTDAGASGSFSSGAIAMSEFYGKRLTAPVTFSPDGSSDINNPVGLEDIGGYNASVFIGCNVNAVWTFNAIYGNGNASIPSGTTSTGVNFNLSTAFQFKFEVFNVSATALGVTRYWTVTLEVGLE